MARLTKNQVRLRAAALLALVAITFAIVILAFALAPSNPWLWVLLALIDVPVLVFMAISERRDRTPE